MGDIVEEHLVETPAFLLAHAGLDRDACVAQNLRALARDERVGVQTANEHAADPALDDGVRAGRRAAPVAARLERDVEVRARRVLRTVFQRVALRVQAAAVLVPALADHAAVPDDHAADHRVGADAARAARGQRQRPAHVFLIFFLQINHLGK